MSTEATMVAQVGAKTLRRTPSLASLDFYRLDYRRGAPTRERKELMQ